RRDELPRPERRVRVARAALEHVPAVVGQRADCGGRAVVDLLPVPLADVADVEVAVRTVEREAPRVAQAEANHLPARAALERVDPQQLPEPLCRALRAVARIAAGAAVSHADVQQPVPLDP